MDSKLKSQRKVLAARPKSQPKAKPDKKAQLRKHGKVAEKLQMPDLVAGREVLGRKLSVIKTTKKEAIWVKGAVKDFDEPTIRHKIKYDLPLPDTLNEPEELTEGEEWLCLSKSGFMWKDDDFKCPYANPTYSSKHTPKREEAIGNRVKVFWTAMSKWYQGRVVDYDPVTGKHRVSFRDGEQNQYDLQQEALVWLDIPQLSSDAALKKMRMEEGQPIAIIRNDENQAPVESKSKAGTQKSSTPGLKSPACKKKAKGLEEAAKEGPKTRRAHMLAKATPKEKPSKDPAVLPGLKKAKGPAGLAENNGTATPDAKKKGEANKSAASTQLPAQCVPAEVKTATKEPAAEQKIAILANSNAKSVGKGSPKTQVKTEEMTKKRSRLGDPALASPATAPPDAKRRALAKTGTAPAKPGRKPKAAGEESRLGAKRQKKETDVKFEESCQCVLGARVGVWWEDDNCYYKGKIVAHDWYRKKLKIRYDDGVEEYIMPFKEETSFMWLTPRAVTAGASGAVHAAFQTLRASNAGQPVPQPVGEGAGDQGALPATSQPSSAQPSAQTPSPHQADGSHLDALVPTQGNGSKDTQTKASAGKESASVGPYPVDSTTRAMSVDSRTPSLLVSALSGAHHIGIPTSTAGLFLGLHSMLGPHHSHALSLPQPLNGLTKRLGVPVSKELLQAAAQSMPAVPPPSSVPRPSSAVSRSGSLQEPSATPQSSGPPVQGSAAEGWKVSIVFRGDQKQYQGRILAYKPESDRHLVLWEDGEDEWIDISQEQLTWHSEKGKSHGFSTGLPAGHLTPQGEKLNGWSLAVFWKHECKFFDGIVVDYDADLDQHTIHYNDGEERCESVHSLIFKYVLPPTVQPVGARRVQPPRRWQDSGSEAEEGTAGYRRQKRRLRGNSQEDDTDEEWIGTKPSFERRGTRQIHNAPPIRHLSLGHHRQHSLLQQHGSSPSVRTPGGSEIRRMSSKCGSLLFFEGEDNPAVSPATSPKTSPQISPVTKQDSGSVDGKVRSAVDRKVTSLKSAMGFKTGVKRVRLYLKGWPPELQKSSDNTGSVEVGKEEKPGSTAGTAPVVKEEPSEAPEIVPNKHLLKLMLDRVEAASLSMQTGTPVPMSAPPPVPAQAEIEKADRAGSVSLPKQSSLPSKSILSTKSAAPLVPSTSLPDTDAEAVGPEVSAGRSQSLPPSASQQDQRLTPPPSPFANCFHSSGAGVEGLESRDNMPFGLPEPSFSTSLAGNGVYSLLGKLRGLSGRGLTGEALASPSHSPETPSALGDNHLLALSRNSSVMSDPILAELLQCKLLSCKSQASWEEQLGLFQPK